MNRYCIEILSDTPPRLFIGDSVAGGQVVAIKSDEPDTVSASWLSEKTGLSKSTITAKLASIAQGSGKKMYARQTALQMLGSTKQRMGRPRKQ